LVDAHGVPVRQSEHVSDLIRIDEILNIHAPAHENQITPVDRIVQDC
jgi:hypothetical protein